MEEYSEILERMEAAYAQAAGHPARDVSDTGLRLQVLAAELERLWHRLEFIRLQAFVQTAQGTYLDLHGAQRGLERFPARQAVGTVTFSRYLPMELDLVIPAGTVCAVSGPDPVEYETTEAGVLAAGTVSVDVPARAVLGGISGNCAPSAINTLIDAPEGVNYCVNRAAFTGGADPEDDEAYRARLQAAYRLPENGANAAYYRRVALSQPGVTAVQVVPRASGPNTVTVYVWGDGAPPAEETLTALRERYARERELGVAVTVAAASAKRINTLVRLLLPDTVPLSAAQPAVEAALGALYAAKQVGDPVYVTELTRAVLEAVPAREVEYGMTVRDVAGVPGVLPVLGTVTVEALS